MRIILLASVLFIGNAVAATETGKAADPANVSKLGKITTDGAKGLMPVVPQITDPAFQAEVLATHNAERRSLGVPDLKWSPELAQEALNWATVIAAKGVIEHENQRVHGECLYSNSIARRTPTLMIKGWLDEKSMYLPGRPHPDVSSTGDWRDVGHYQAMIWASTTSVGCAIGRGAERDFLVCRYDPIGNRRGYAAYDVTAVPRVAGAAAAPASTMVAKQ
jgi:hypothetical protein